MRLNRFVLACFLVIVPVTVFVAMQFHAPNPGATPANFMRLHKGMDEKEVEAIMGRPGDYRMGFTGNHCTFWRELHCSVVIGFSDITIDGISLGAKDGELSMKGGGKLELREEPSSFGIHKWLAMLVDRLRTR